MPHVVADRVKETTSTTGTADFVLTGAVSGFRTFLSAMAIGDTTWYCAVNGTEWEVGVGFLDTPGTELERDVIASSNSNALVSFTAAPTVFCTLPGLAAGGIGVGQTWQSVTRTTGVNYTNTNGRPILLASGVVSANGQHNVNVGGVQFRASDTSGTGMQMCVLIPDGAVYSITGTGVASWFELK